MQTIQLCIIIWQYCCFYTFFINEIAALVSIRDLFSETLTKILIIKIIFAVYIYCILICAFPLIIYCMVYVTFISKNVTTSVCIILKGMTTVSN